MTKAYDVFISYRRSDGKETAIQLQKYLDSKGVRAFFDQRDIDTGVDFTDELRGTVRRTPHYVLIGTKNTFEFRKENKETGDLDFVREEIRLALEVNPKQIDKHTGKPTGKKTDHTCTVLFTSGCGFPSRAELPEDVRDIMDKNSVDEKECGREAAFEKILGVVTNISRINLWHAAQKWLENGKKPGGRFARLHIDESIMPGAEKKTRRAVFPTEVSIGKENDIVPLIDAVNAAKGNLYLIGEGGIGKTTALIRIMEEAYGKEYSDKCRIPIFVELSFAPDRKGKWIEGMRSTFILRSIYKQVADRIGADQGAYVDSKSFDVFDEDNAKTVDPLMELFSAKNDEPEYLLLLDGLNEVSRAEIIGGGGETVAGLVIREIREIINGFPNVRVILTSRSDDEAVPFDGFSRYFIAGVSEEQIKQYLAASTLPADAVKAALGNKELMKTLRVPLFLSMYATLKNTNGILTQGEILHGFFHERRENLYTEQDRMSETERNVSASESVLDRKRLTADMKMLTLDLILPQIGYEMQSKQEFYQRPGKLYDPILKILNGRKITDECGRYGKYVFPVKGRLEERSPKELAKSILEIFDEEDAADEIINSLVKEIGVFQISGGEYGFIHQHLRDYFSAIRYINAMKLAVYLYENDEKTEALELVTRYLHDAPVDYQIRRFIGEITGEHHNKPVYENKARKLPGKAKDSLIMKTLGIYRGVGCKDAGCAVYTLVHILDEARGELSGCDLSRLDFTECNLNGMRLSRPGLPADFRNAVLNGRNLTYEGHKEIITSVCYSPDGTRILTSSRDQTVKIWHAATLQVLGTLEGHKGIITFVCYSPDGKRIVTASGQGAAQIWDAESFELLGSIDTHDFLISVSYSPDGKRIITVPQDKNAKIWDAESFELLGTLEGHTDWVNSASYSPDGKRIVTASDDNTAKIWDAESFELLCTLEGHKGAVFSVSYSPDGKRIVTASTDETAKIWDAKNFEPLGTLEGHKRRVISASYSPDGKHIVTTSDDGTVKVWDADNYKLITTIRHEHYVRSASYSPDGKRIVVADGASLKVYETFKYSLIEKTNGVTIAEDYAEFSPSGGSFIAVAKDHTAKIWDTKSLILRATIEEQEKKTFSASYSPDGKRIVAPSNNGTVLIWDVESCEPAGALEGHTSGVETAFYSPRGDRIITASWDRTAKIWNAESCEPLGTLEGHEGAVVSALYSPDGKRIVTASRDKTAKIWDAESYELLGTIDTGDDLLNSASYSPDGKRIITTSLHSSAKVWDSESLESLGTLEGHEAVITSASYSPDGKRIVAAPRYARSATIWDADRFEPVETLIGYWPRVNSARYSADGKFIITASEDGTVGIWDAEKYECIKAVTSIPGMNFIGVDFTALDLRSAFDEEEKETVRRYGGII
ncbi:MAG: TIR domain-containing protein [Clostridia bacterium]|nr:TIR domain-containing protein [Clostridia bacterium]